MLTEAGLKAPAAALAQRIYRVGPSGRRAGATRTLKPAASTTATSANTSAPRTTRAGITTAGERLTLHSLRHGFDSLLISQGLNVVFVSRQLGHANPNITLGTYARLYARADHTATARAALDASYVALTQSRR